MTPRLAVTQEQAEDIASAFAMKRAWAPVTLRLPERPTMPCPTCEGSLSVGEPGFTYYGIPEPGSYEACPDCMDDHGIPDGAVPIPERTRVRVEYPCDVCDGSGRGSLDGRPQDWLMCGECNGKGWHPVALATLTEVHAALADGQPYRWYVTLSDIKPVEADQ